MLTHLLHPNRAANLCLELATELVIGIYAMPAPNDPDCLLARHDTGLVEEARSCLNEAGGEHRSEYFNRFVLPLCLPLVVEVIRQRMAYENVVAAGVHPTLIKASSDWRGSG